MLVCGNLKAFHIFKRATAQLNFHDKNGSRDHMLEGILGGRFKTKNNCVKRQKIAHKIIEIGTKQWVVLFECGCIEFNTDLIHGYLHNILGSNSALVILFNFARYSQNWDYSCRTFTDTDLSLNCVYWYIAHFFNVVSVLYCKWKF